MNRKALLYHGMFWLALYILWVAVFRAYSVPISKTMTIEFCYLIFITVDYYVINSFIVPTYLRQRKYLQFVAATVLTIGISAALRSLVALKVSTTVFHSAVPFEFQTLFVNSLLNISIWVLAVTVAKMLGDNMETQANVETLEKEKTKAELEFLKAQINPHSLFNSLNTIYGEIDKNNQTARNTLLSFSELLRYQLYECNEERVSLNSEIDYLKRYAAFQQLRKNENLIVAFNVDVREKGKLIAPLLLVVLVENAFKFVSNDVDRKNKITIAIELKGNRLEMIVINTKEKENEMTINLHAGIGLKNLQRRLSLLYEDKHTFTVIDSREEYEARLILDLS